MATNSVKLLVVWARPFMNRVHITLKIKSIESEFIQQNMLPKVSFSLNPTLFYKKIPVLIHDEKPICESLVILHYIDDAWLSGPSILYDHYDLVSQGKDAIKATLEPVFSSLVLLEDAFKNCNKGKKFFGRDKIGYMDVALGYFLSWMRVTEKMNNVILLDEAILGLYRWAEDFCADSPVEDVIPKTNKLVEAAKDLLPKIRANGI
ncbi:hypothetical protein H5410_060836 [Solanum commersonii]|uniref:Glutathione S-transferase n=1 Tax=Solanum commersonii TaxID=4109 RepID=A0A9J5W7R4_SOLCO|nr:hypothetical protein H5410_060836 [Solanum commersonii]